MNLSLEMMLQLIIIVPLLATIGIAAAYRHPNVRDAVTILASVVVLILVFKVYGAFKAGYITSVEWIEIFPGLSISFKTEALGVIFSLVAGCLWLVTSVYSIGYMRGNNEHNQTQFALLFAIAISATMGIALSANLITLFIFYEILTFSTFPLVTHKGDEKSMKAGRVYLGVLVTTSICLLLPAIIWTWYLTGTTDFAAGGIIAGKLQGPLLTLLAFLFIFGIGKAAIMPVHRWLPAAMVAPTPVSALLHAVAVVKAGVFSVTKIIVYTFGIELLVQAPNIEWFLYCAGFTIIMASIVALRQDNLKRRLAYSTISQLSYVVLATAILAPISIVGAALHIVAHAFGKITLFFAAGSIYTASHKTEISQLDGIGHRMPWTMGAFTIGALSMIGVPPAVGFISKWYVLMGAFQAEQIVAIIIIIGSTLLNAAYFVPIIFSAFFKKEDPEHHYEHREAPLPIVLALTTTAACTILLFFFPGIPFELAEMIKVASL